MNDEQREQNNEIRYSLYRKYARELDACDPGDNQRRQLPHCVECLIRRIYPESSRYYTGFQLK